MRPPSAFPSRSRRAFLAGIGLTLAACSAFGQGPVVPSRQVTMFGILATPGGNKVDPKLKQIAPQLNKLFPNHSFQLLAVESKRLTPGQSITAKLGDGFVAGTELTSVLDNDGNVQFKFALELNGQTEFATFVKTPPQSALLLRQDAAQQLAVADWLGRAVSVRES